VDIRRVIGGNVRRYRLAAGFSQEELAARLGLEQSYVSELESGKKNPTAVTLWHIAVALNVKPEMLLKAGRIRRRKQGVRLNTRLPT
jgi:transcriptional regulator with XRE-family HTH domain